MEDESEEGEILDSEEGEIADSEDDGTQNNSESGKKKREHSPASRGHSRSRSRSEEDRRKDSRSRSRSRSRSQSQDRRKRGRRGRNYRSRRTEDSSEEEGGTSGDERDEFGRIIKSKNLGAVRERSKGDGSSISHSNNNVETRDCATQTDPSNMANTVGDTGGSRQDILDIPAEDLLMEPAVQMGVPAPSENVEHSDQVLSATVLSSSSSSSDAAHQSPPPTTSVAQATETLQLETKLLNLQQEVSQFQAQISVQKQMLQEEKRRRKVAEQQREESEKNWKVAAKSMQQHNNELASRLVSAEEIIMSVSESFQSLVDAASNSTVTT